MIFRIAAMFCLVTSGFLMGNLLAEELKNKTNYFNAWATVVKDIRNHVQYHTGPILTAVATCAAAKNVFEPCLFEVKSNLPLQYKKAIKASPNAKYLKPEQLIFLQDIFYRLGSNGKDEELQKLCEAEEKLEIWLADARREERENARLYRSIGLYSGIAIAIILI